MSTASDPIQLTTQLMSIESTSGREGDVIAWLDRYLIDRGWRTTRIWVSEGRDDLFATVHEAPLVTLSTHLDTVPPFIPPTRDDRKEIIAGEVVAALCAHLGVDTIATGATSATTDEVQS